MSEVDRLVEPVSAQLGESGFLRRYVRWAVTQTDAPVTFHVLTGLMGIATTVPADAKIEMGVGTQAPNLFGMIVGESGRARKSWSMGLVRRLLENACPDRLGLRIGSYEAAIAAVAEQPYMTIFEPEFSRFLSQAKGGAAAGYMNALKTGLTDLYDCSPISRRTMKIRHEVKKYRVNLIGAISDDYLSDYTDPSDFTGGFLSRWLFASGDRTRLLKEPDASEAAQQEQTELSNLLRRLYNHAPAGTYYLDPAAQGMYLDWIEALDNLGAKADRRLVGMIERAAPLGRRVATLLAMDRMVNREGFEQEQFSHDFFTQALARNSAAPSTDRWIVTTADLETAMHVVAAHLSAAQRIVAKVEHTPTARTKAKVLHAFPEGTAVPLGHLTRVTGLRKKEVMEILDTLRGEDRVVPILMNGAQWWARAVEESARPDGPTALPLPTGVVQHAPVPEIPLAGMKPQPIFDLSVGSAEYVDLSLLRDDE